MRNGRERSFTAECLASRGRRRLTGASVRRTLLRRAPHDEVLGMSIAD